MSFADTLLPGSFRGVPFEIERASTSGAPKRVVHEYPQSDRNDVEYLGKGPRRFTLQFFVFTHDNFDARNAMEDALDDNSPGELIHPYRGTLQVAVEQNWTAEESKDANGKVTFNVSFIIDQVPTLPAASIDSQALTESLADAAELAVQDDFATSFDVAGVTDTELSLSTLTDTVKSIGAAVDAAYLAVDATYTQLLTAALDPLAGARSLLSDIINLPGEVAARISGLIGNITRVADLSSLFDRYSSNDGSAGFLANASGSNGSPFGGVFIPPGGTSSAAPGGVVSARALANQAAVINLVKSAIAVRGAQLTASTHYGSYDDAQADLARVTDQLDAVMASAGSDTLPVLQDLRAAVVADLTKRAANLQIVTHYTPQETLPALVIAHALYGAAGLEANVDDLVARNQVKNPGAVPGGQMLEVLSA